MNVESPPKGRLADLPLDERIALDEATRHELHEGLTRRHVQNARERDALAVANLARAMKHVGGKG